MLLSTLLNTTFDPNMYILRFTETFQYHDHLVDVDPYHTVMMTHSMLDALSHKCLQDTGTHFM